LTVKRSKIFIINLSRSYEFWFSLDPPIQSVKVSRPVLGIGKRGLKLISHDQLVLILRMSGGIIPNPYICVYIYIYIYIYMASLLVSTRKNYITSYHMQSIFVRIYLQEINGHF